MKHFPLEHKVKEKNIQCPGLVFSQIYPDIEEREWGGRGGEGRAEGKSSSNSESKGRKRIFAGWWVIQALLMTNELACSVELNSQVGKMISAPHTFPAIVLRSQSCGSSIPSPAVGYLFMFLFAIKSIPLFSMSWHSRFLNWGSWQQILKNFFFI